MKSFSKKPENNAQESKGLQMQIKTLKLNTIVSALILLSPGLVAAQTLPDAGSLLRDIQNEQNIPAQVPQITEKLQPPLKDSGIQVELKQVVFEGYDVMTTEAELQALVKDFIGKQVGFATMQYLADLVTEHLKNKGFFLAFAYLPEQDISQGVLNIKIQPGRIESNGVRIQHDDAQQRVRLTDERISKTLNASLTPDINNIIHSLQLERGILLLNDLAGVSARSNLEAGAEQGTTRINVELKETPRYNGNAWIDNYGNRFTGSWRASAMGYINNVSGIGDQFNMMVNVTEFMTYGRAAYQAPLGYSGLTGNASVSYLDYVIDKSLTKPIESDGSALNGTLGLRYPIIRTRQQNLYVSGNYDYKLLKDYNNVTQDSRRALDKERVVNVVTLGLNGDKLDQYFGGGLNNWGISLTAGSLDLSGSPVKEDGLSAEDRDKATADTQGGYAKLAFNANRLQKISSEWSLFVSGSAQPYASKNLDSSEKFSIGGSNAVRAYASGEMSGDTGYLMTLEARYDVPGTFVFDSNLQLQAFIDHGVVTQQSETWDSFTDKNNQHLTGVGIGLTLAKNQVYSLKTSYAWKIDDQYQDRNTGTKFDSEQRKNDGRFWLQLMGYF